MKNPKPVRIKTFAIIAACGFTLSACVQALWNITFTQNGTDGTIASFVAPGPAGSVLLAGAILLPGDGQSFLPRSNPYVARYADNGELQWRYVPDDGTSFLGTTSLASAGDGSIYFTDTRESATVLTRLDAAGNLLWEYRRPQPDLFNADLALLVKVVDDDRVLMGITRQFDSGNPPGTLLALDSQGQLLWEFSGIGSGGFDPTALFDAEVLPGGRIATFHSFAPWFQQPDQTGAISILDRDGNLLDSTGLADLGLTRILDLAMLDDRLAVAGLTAQGSRILVLDSSLGVLQQRDFAETTSGRVVAQGNTLCFALMTVVEDGEYIGVGSATLGIIDHNGRATWDTRIQGYHSRNASLTVDNHRCAYTSLTLAAAQGDAPGPAQTQTLLYSVRGMLDTVTVPGDPGPANFGHALLQGQVLYTASTSVGPSPEVYDEPPEATLHKHRLY